MTNYRYGVEREKEVYKMEIWYIWVVLTALGILFNTEMTIGLMRYRFIQDRMKAVRVKIRKKTYIYLLMMYWCILTLTWWGIFLHSAYFEIDKMMYLSLPIAFASFLALMWTSFLSWIFMESSEAL